MKKYYMFILLATLAPVIMRAYTHHITNKTPERLKVRAHFQSCSETIEKELNPGETGNFSTSGLKVGCVIDGLTAKDMTGTRVADEGLGNGMVVTTGSFTIEPAKPGSDTKYKYEFNVN
jgi:hypothetical protein